MTFKCVIVVVLMVTVLHSVLSDPSPASEKKKVPAKLKVVPLKTHASTYPEHKAGVNLHHAPVNKLAVHPSGGKATSKLGSTKSKMTTSKKKKKPKSALKKIGKLFRMRGRTLRKKIRKALKPKRKLRILTGRGNKMAAKRNKMTGKRNKKIQIKPKKSKKQLRNILRMRPRKNRTRGRTGVGKKKKWWKRPRKFPGRRIKLRKGRKGTKGKRVNLKNTLRKRPRKLRIKFKGRRNRQKKLNAIRAAIMALRRQVKNKGKKKSAMRTGYLRRVVGLPAKRLKEKKTARKLTLQDILKRTGMKLDKDGKPVYTKVKKSLKNKGKKRKGKAMRNLKKTKINKPAKKPLKTT